MISTAAAVKPVLLAGKILSPNSLQFERLLPIPVEQAWEYLTRPDLLKLWLASGTFEPREGGKVDLQFENDPLRSEEVCHTRGTILEWNPPTRLSYTWMEQNVGDPDQPTVVIFELAPAPGGSLLTLTHQRLQAPGIHLYMAGWHTHLAVLGARIQQIEPPAFNQLFKEMLPTYKAMEENQ